MAYRPPNAKKFQGLSVRKVPPYRPHSGGQATFHAHSGCKTRIIVAGRRWGKDRATINDMIRNAVKIALHRLKHGTGGHVLIPLVHVWVVAPDYPRLRQWWAELKRFIPADMMARHPNNSDKTIEMSLTKSMDPHILIELKSATDPESLVSVGLDILVISEAGSVKARAWTESLMPCLISPGRVGMTIINGTPKGRSNWLYKEFCDAETEMREKGAASTSWCIRAPTRTNPYIDEAAFRALEKKMPTRKRRQELWAEFLGMGDAFFPPVTDRILPWGIEVEDIQLPIIIPIDWGRTDNPTIFIAMDAAGRMLAGEKHQAERFSMQFKNLHKFVDALAVPVEEIVFAPDATALQSAFAERIEEEFTDNRGRGPVVEPIRMTLPLKENMMDALAFDLEASGTDGVWLLDEPELINQIEIFEQGDMKNTAQQKKSDEFDAHHFDWLFTLAQGNWIRRDYQHSGGGLAIGQS